MGKKKASKVQRPEDPEEVASGESDQGAAVLKNLSKKEKKKRKDVDMEDISKEFEDMALEQASGQPKSSEEKSNLKVNGATKKASKKQAVKPREESSEEDDEEGKVVVKSKFSGFAALAGDDMMADLGDEMDDDDDDEDEAAESSKAEERVPTPPPAPKQAKGKQKGKKDKKPALDDDWDDLEGLVTPPPAMDTAVNKKDKNKKEKKGKKGKRADDDDEDDFDKLLAEARLADGVTKSLEDNPDVKVEEPEESKSKKRRKRKGKGGDAGVEDEDGAPVAAEKPSPSVPLDDASPPASVEEGEAAPPEDPAPPEDAAPANDSAGPSRASHSGESTPALADDGKSKRQKRKEAEEEKKRKKQEEEELKQKKLEEEEEKKRAKKGLPNKKVLAAMKELQQKKKEEEERIRREEEELERLEEERMNKEEEEKQLEAERKERKKQKEKDRKERLKAEGRLLTAKQKADKRRAEEMLEHLKAQGVNIPESGAKKAPRLGSKAYAKKKVTQAKQDEAVGEEEEEGSQHPAVLERMSSGETSPPPTEEPLKKEDIKESWDISSDEAEDEDEDEPDTSGSAKAQDSKQKQGDKTPEESSEEDATEEDISEDDEPQTPREKVIARLRKRKETNETNRDIEKLRAPVVCVLGHVDHGKTKILDKLRRTNVQEGEVGGITQQIGATNVPAEAIAAQTKMVKSFITSSLKFPGLLIIDTPGHESFSNLRNRGSSLCDLAILVVDITQGLEPQTIESIELLKKRKTPFVVALNKVDRVFEWESNQHKDIREIIKNQKETAKMDFERRTKDIIMKLNEQGLNAALFHENPDPRSYVSLVPTSAITGDGMGNLIALVCDMCQSKLATQLRFSEELQCIVLEVKTIQGHGTTIDVILVNGRLREGDNIVLAGTDGPIVTQIRSLLMPKPMKEIRVKGAYDEFKEVMAAQGVKLAAKDLDKAIAGLSLRVAHHDDEIEILKELVDKDFKQAMRAIKVKDKGVYVQASTLGALEALLEFFKTKSIPYSGIRVGPVVKRDVMKAAAMLEHDDKYAVILAFDVKVERDAQELADREGVKIFSEETIYHLGDRYVEYLEEYKRKQQDENRSVAIFPCKLKILPTSIFNKRDPIVLGVTVDSGILRTGTLLCVPAKEFVEIGIVTSMEFDHKPVDIAKKGVDVCIKIDPSQGTTPKLYGRHFEAPDEIVSKISRESINACKDYFRDDLSKADWKLMAELKKLFNIL